MLIEAGADVNATSKTGSTPLHVAGQQGQTQIGRLLIDAGAHIDAVDKQGNTPLSMAMASVSWARRASEVDEQPYEATVKALKDAGAVNDGRTKLQRAVEAGDMNVVQELLTAKADVNETGPERITAAHIASERGHAKILEALIGAGAKVDQSDMHGMRPLHLAANAETARLLIANGAKVGSRMPSPLYMAAVEGRADVVRELLGNADRVKDSECAALLNWATFAGQIDVIRVLFEVRDAETLLTLPSTYSPLHVAAGGSYGDMSCPKRVTPQHRLTIARFLVEKGADVNARWGSNVNPASGAAHMINTTPLMFACSRGEAEMVRFLLDRKADPNAVNASGQTALHFAATSGHRPVVELLLAAKADVNALTKEAETPLDMSQDAGVKVLLIQNGGKPAKETLKDTNRR